MDELLDAVRSKMGGFHKKMGPATLQKHNCLSFPCSSTLLSSRASLARERQFR